MKSFKLTLGILAISQLFSCSSNNIVNDIQPVQENVQISSNNEFDTKGISKKYVLVKLKNNSIKAQNFSTKYQTKVKNIIPKINVMVIEIPESKTSQNFLQVLKSDKDVLFAEPDVKVELDEFNDPMIKDQYALKKVDAFGAWEVNQGNSDTIIAIVDSGVDLEHPDLKAKLLEGYNAVNPGTPPKDDVRHGTHVSGIASAIGDNGIGVSGLAPKCKILPVKVLGNGTGSIATISDGLIWAADHGADVVNMSLGTYTEEKTLGEAVKYALSKNVVCVATMGNDNMEKRRFPAGFPGMIAVGSTDENDKKSTFSNYGDWITVSAPGTAILSTLPTPASYGKMSGTSMAAPLVTGLVGLMRSQSKNLSPADASKILKEASDDLGDSGFDKYFGAGRVNAAKTLNLLKKLK
ncbi:MAG: S8 family peptidase [Candidatus Sericytochromatia bacterium]